MKIMTIEKNAVVIASKKDGKLPAALKGKMFRRGLVIGASRHLPVLLSHFEKGVIIIGNALSAE